MKKQMIDFVRSLGGEARYSGKWPETLFVSSFTAGVNNQMLIDALIMRFSRHTQIRFL
jgi:hypothetical protein